MVSVAILFAVGLFAVLAWRVAVGPGGATEIRIGYSTLTPLHCALGEVLASTDILARHGLRGTFTGFEHGKDQHESCAQGVVDATFSCEVPAMVHLDRLPGMVLEGSPGELGEIALVVPADSPIRSIADLDGRTLALLGGASSELVVEQWLAEDGLWRDRDVRCEMHGGIGESAVAAVTGGQVDAAHLTRGHDGPEGPGGGIDQHDLVIGGRLGGRHLPLDLTLGERHVQARLDELRIAHERAEPVGLAP